MIAAPRPKPHPSRSSTICDARAPRCPNSACGEVLRRVLVASGIAFGFCEAQYPREVLGAGGRTVTRRTRCGQHSVIHGIAGGLAVVTAISPEEFSELAGVTAPEGLMPYAVYARLGILLAVRDRLGELMVPRVACPSCSTLRLLDDMYGGQCRWCRDGLTPPPLVV
jgi:hypothetical protein